MNLNGIVAVRNASFVFVRRVSGNSGYDMDRMRTREIPGSGRNCIKKKLVNAEYA